MPSQWYNLQDFQNSELLGEKHQIRFKAENYRGMYIGEEVHRLFFSGEWALLTT